MPILSSKIIASSVRIRTTRDSPLFPCRNLAEIFLCVKGYHLRIPRDSEGVCIPRLHKRESLPEGSADRRWHIRKIRIPCSALPGLLCAIRLPGAPIRERFPPMAAANTSGISRRDLLYPDFAAIPITTGIRTAAVPVLDKHPAHQSDDYHDGYDQHPFASSQTLIRSSRTLFAIPVSNSAPPTINIAHKQNYVAVDESCKCCLRIQYSSDVPNRYRRS